MWPVDEGPGAHNFAHARLGQYEGCLLGLAIGDALGAPVEFLSLEEILDEYGPDGVCGLEPWRDFRAGCFTDDTQMSIATARGCVDAYLALRHGEPWRPAHAVYRRYLVWLRSQNIAYMNRAPGATCLWALRSGRMGTIEAPFNTRKGCGGVMRVAPAGLAFPPGQAFQYGAEFAAITHGHPSGYLSAGVLAEMVALLLEGREMAQCVDASVKALKRWRGHEETLAKVEQARQLATDLVSPREAIPSLGAGWVGEEALAIALYCSLYLQHDWETAVLAAVNHSGDSDSTGSITGAILGTLHGREALPSSWVAQLETVSGIRAVAEDLYLVVREGVEPQYQDDNP
ncbi:MAG: ADP-ribosylglycohydrolase family protein [Dehalococcoidia bacterium]|nr:ADP-ribosylglycohydrolase family protein [Dehalococcoidia bacterium]